MNVIIGILAGIITTALIARHYYKRTTNKSITPYRIISTSIFSGIDEEVRKQLHFTFEDKEVTELQQVEFIIVNDGEQAISNMIEPLTLRLPRTVEILDTSIIHQSPNDLHCTVSTHEDEDGVRVVFNFPLLNKGDYFLVKLLISGFVPLRDLEFTLLADDLPRKLKFSTLPSNAFQERKVSIEWGAVLIGIVLLGVGTTVGYSLLNLAKYQPTLFPFPFELSFRYCLVVLPACLLLLSLGFAGIALMIGIGFRNLFSIGPRFPLPRHFRRNVFLHETYPSGLAIYDMNEPEQEATQQLHKPASGQLDVQR